MRLFYFRKNWLLVAVILSFVPSMAFCDDSRFKDKGDGTVKDTVTNLVWIKHPDNSPAIRGIMFWITAKKACDNLEFAGHGPHEWRLPNVKELQTLIDENDHSPRINNVVFSAFGEAYWSSTDDSGNSPRAWIVNFANGELGSYPKLSLVKPVPARARCVRSEE